MKRVLTLLLSGLSAFAAPSPADPRFSAIFGAPQAHSPAISPDGRHVSFGIREGDKVFLGVLDVNAATIATRVQVGVDEFRDHGSFVTIRRPQIRSIVWISARRMIVVSDFYDIFAVDFDGTNLVPLCDAKSIQWHHTINNPSAPTTTWAPYQDTTTTVRRPVRLATVTVDGAVALVEAGGTFNLGVTNGDQDMSLYSIDVRTGRSSRVGDLSVNGRLFYNHIGQLRVYHATRNLPFRVYQRPAEGILDNWLPLDLQEETLPSEFTSAPENLIGHRSLPVGFAFDASTIYIASNVGRDTYGIYGFDLSSGHRTPEAIEIPKVDLILPTAFEHDSTLMLDRHRQKLVGVRLHALKSGVFWLDRELREVQARIDAKAPRRSMEILGWDDTRERFLVHGYHRADPGAYMVYTKSDDALREYLPLMTQSITASQLVSTNWSIQLPNGRSLSGNLTRSAGRERLPTVIIFPQRAWLRPGPEFSPEVSAFARMGFAVLEVNTRGLPGYGLEHWLAAREEPDRVVAEDVFAALDTIAETAGIEKTKVTLFGSHFGGWHALRTLQFYPNRIRSVAVIDPVTDLAGWIAGAKSGDPQRKQYYAALQAYFGSDAEKLKRFSPLQHPFPPGVPVFVAQTQTTFTPGMDFRPLRDATRKANTRSQWLDPSLIRNPDTDRTDAFIKIQSFLRANRE